MPKTGLEGKIYIDTSEVGDVKNITYDSANDVKKYTSSSTGGLTKTAKGNTEFTGQFEMMLDDAGEQSPGVTIGEEYTLKMASSSTKNSELTVRITNISVGIDIEGAEFMGATISWIGDGDITFNAA